MTNFEQLEKCLDYLKTVEESKFCFKSYVEEFDEEKGKVEICFIDLKTLFPSDWSWAKGGAYDSKNKYYVPLLNSQPHLEPWDAIKLFFLLDNHQYNSLFAGEDYGSILEIPGDSDLKTVINHWERVFIAIKQRNLKIN